KSPASPQTKSAPSGTNSRRPVVRLSRTTTASPRFASACAAWLPIYPAPPVIRTHMNRLQPAPVTPPHGPNDTHCGYTNTTAFCTYLNKILVILAPDFNVSAPIARTGDKALCQNASGAAQQKCSAAPLTPFVEDGPTASVIIAHSGFRRITSNGVL